MFDRLKDIEKRWDAMPVGPWRVDGADPRWVVRDAHGRALLETADKAVARELAASPVDGVHWRPAYYRPTFHKFGGRTIGGTALHWDGNEFTAQTAGTSRDLISLWGTGPNHIVAVGGRANGVYAVWDGSSWTSHELQPLPGLNGVWMDKPNVAHAVGVAGTIVTIHLDTGEVVQEDSGTSRLEFHSVHGDRDNHTLYAVGGNFDKGNDDPYVGIVVQRKLGSDE